MHCGWLRLCTKIDIQAMIFFLYLKKESFELNIIVYFKYFEQCVCY